MIQIRARGQLLPLWTVGILTSLVLMYFAVNYGNMLRWQMRAQNNADAAASMFVSLQTESWNQMTALLYASDIEEFRIRKQFDDLFLLVHNAGGCRGADNGLDTTACSNAWTYMSPFFQAAVTRYTADATVLQSVIENASYSRVYGSASSSDMNLLLKSLNNAAAGSCIDKSNTASWLPQNGDCAFYYKVLAVQQRGGLLSATEDAWNRAVPLPGTGPSSYRRPLTPCNTVPGPCSPSITSEPANAQSGSPVFNNELFAPVQIEVSTCSDVKPIIPNFFGLKSNDFYAVGRAAATAVIVDQDWLQPGVFAPLYSATGISVFQGGEDYENYWDGHGMSGGPQSWLNLNFNDNNGISWADTGSHYAWFNPPTTGNDFEVETAWWAPIPIAPFSQINGASATPAQQLIGTSGAPGTTCQALRS